MDDTYVPPTDDDPGAARRHREAQPGWDPDVRSPLSTDAIRRIFDHPAYPWTVRMTIVGLCEEVDRARKFEDDRLDLDASMRALCDTAWNS